MLKLLTFHSSPDHLTDRHVLVLLDDFAIKSSHSLFFNTLQSCGFDLDFKLADDPKINIQLYDQYTYDALILFSPTVDRIKEKEGLKLLVNGGPRAQKMICIWLFGSAVLVFSMVILGGATRLTRSGLSMTDWKFTGGLSPLSDKEWLIEFDKYKQSPECKRLVQNANKHCSIF